MTDNLEPASAAATPVEKKGRIWWNDGRAQREWEFTQSALRLCNNTKNLDVIKGINSGLITLFYKLSRRRKFTPQVQTNPLLL